MPHPIEIGFVVENLPVVTLPGDTLLSRYTLGCYSRKGLLDLVAESPADYVQKALRVARDQDYRRYLRQELASRSDVLFNDLTAVEEHERFFEEAIGLHRPLKAYWRIARL